MCTCPVVRGLLKEKYHMKPGAQLGQPMMIQEDQGRHKLALEKYPEVSDSESMSDDDGPGYEYQQFENEKPRKKIKKAATTRTRNTPIIVKVVTLKRGPPEEEQQQSKRRRRRRRLGGHGTGNPIA
jgi:hypothetical protein